MDAFIHPLGAASPRVHVMNTSGSLPEVCITSRGRHFQCRSDAHLNYCPTPAAPAAAAAVGNPKPTIRRQLAASQDFNLRNSLRSSHLPMRAHIINPMFGQQPAPLQMPATHATTTRRRMVSSIQNTCSTTPPVPLLALTRVLQQNSPQTQGPQNEIPSASHPSSTRPFISSAISTQPTNLSFLPPKEKALVETSRIQTQWHSKVPQSFCLPQQATSRTEILQRPIGGGGSAAFRENNNVPVVSAPSPLLTAFSSHTLGEAAHCIPSAASGELSRSQFFSRCPVMAPSTSRVSRSDLQTSPKDCKYLSEGNAFRRLQKEHHMDVAKRRALLRATIPKDKQWSEVGVAVYRVGVGMYHSSVVVDNIEWHFWEGLGVEPVPRYFDEVQRAFVSVDHVPFVAYVPIDTLMVSPWIVATICEELGQTQFSHHTYDIICCNCNHFTLATLERLHLSGKMPPWINRLAVTADALCNRLPFVRNWIDTLLSRKTVINRDTPLDTQQTDAKHVASDPGETRLHSKLKRPCSPFTASMAIKAYSQANSANRSGVTTNSSYFSASSAGSPSVQSRNYTHFEQSTETSSPLLPPSELSAEETSTGYGQAYLFSSTDRGLDRSPPAHASASPQPLAAVLSPDINLGVNHDHPGRMGGRYTLQTYRSPRIPQNSSSAESSTLAPSSSIEGEDLNLDSSSPSLSDSTTLRKSKKHMFAESKQHPFFPNSLKTHVPQNGHGSPCHIGHLNTSQ